MNNHVVSVGRENFSLKRAERERERERERGVFIPAKHSTAQHSNQPQLLSPLQHKRRAEACLHPTPNPAMR
jgi:hypothetical protein